MARNDKSSDEQKKKGRSPGIRRMIAAAAFMPMAGRAPLYARLIWSLIQDERVPMTRKALLGAALGYVALGRDVVPDRVPLLGQLDDLVMVALAIDLFTDGLDEDLLNEEHLRRMDQVLLRRNLDHARMFSRKLSLELQQYVHLYTPEANELRRRIEKYMVMERMIEREMARRHTY